MDILEGLHAYLSAQAGITAKVSTRIYQNVVPQNVAKPYLTLEQISVTTRYTHQGDADLDTARIQISAIGDTLKSANEVSIAVHTALSGYVGAMSSVNTYGTFRDNKQNFYEDDTKLHVSTQDYFITY
jgi:hypothetical protein